MGRKPGPNPEKLTKIKISLEKSPNGIWIREIARRTEMDKSTISIYLRKYLSDQIEYLFSPDNKWIKIVRLKNE